jgi:hypothetical protein
MSKFQNFVKRIKIKYNEDVVHYVEEDFDMITDEIEKSLLEIKEAYDIPTEEIEKSVLSRRESKKNNIR